MNQKEFIVKKLCDMGFEPEEVENIGMVFSYEDMHYLYMPDENDEKFLRIALPNIFDVTDDNRIEVLEAVSYVENILKYAKFCIMYDTSLWTVYEHHLVSNENIKELLEHIIEVLQTSASVFDKKINGEEIDIPSENSDDEIDEALDCIDDDDDK